MLLNNDAFLYPSDLNLIPGQELFNSQTMMPNDGLFVSQHIPVTSGDSNIGWVPFGTEQPETKKDANETLSEKIEKELINISNLDNTSNDIIYSDDMEKTEDEVKENIINEVPIEINSLKEEIKSINSKIKNINLDINTDEGKEISINPFENYKNDKEEYIHTSPISFGKPTDVSYNETEIGVILDTQGNKEGNTEDPINNYFIDDSIENNIYEQKHSQNKEYGLDESSKEFKKERNIEDTFEIGEQYKETKQEANDTNSPYQIAKSYGVPESIINYIEKEQDDKDQRPQYDTKDYDNKYIEDDKGYVKIPEKNIIKDTQTIREVEKSYTEYIEQTDDNLAFRVSEIEKEIKNIKRNIDERIDGSLDKYTTKLSKSLQ